MRSRQISSLGIVFAVGVPLAGCGESDLGSIPAGDCSHEVTTIKGTSEWDWAHVDVPEVLNGVAGGPSGYFAVGSVTKRSKDGRNWRTTSGAGRSLFHAVVALEDDVFIGVGDGSSAINGHAIAGNPPTGQQRTLRAMAWSGSIGIAVGDGGELVTTRDGLTYERHDPIAAVDLGAAAWTGREFIVGGMDGRVFISQNALEWTEELTSIASPITGLVSHVGTQLAVTESGQIWRRGSPTWVLEWEDAGTTLRDIAWGAGVYVAAGNHSTLVLSTDGDCWKSTTLAVESDFTGVAGREDGLVVVGTNTVILTTRDGHTWEIRPPGPYHHLADLAWNGAVMVAS